MHGPTLPVSIETHQTKYREAGESFEDAMRRVAVALADDGIHAKRFEEILLAMRFLPGGRIQAAAGSKRRVTMLNCFGSGTIEDSLIDGDGCIMDRLREGVTTMRLGGGIGYDWSTLRPELALIAKLQSTSSGPLAFMDMYSAACLAIASAGHRRGAQMGVMRVDHLDIEKFITAKHNTGRLNGFNLSVAITDEFMEAVARGSTFDLRFGGRVFKTVDARELWELIMTSTKDWAEPGVLFIDTINRMNNLSYCEVIATTNPCAEQPLPPYGACLLGSINLVQYMKVDLLGEYYIDEDQLMEDLWVIVPAMDNVIDRSLFPLEQQKKEAADKRRMGVGITGLANALEAMGHPYGSIEFLYWETRLMTLVRDTCYRASVDRAKEKGPFPLFDERYLDSPFIKTLPEDIQFDIAAHGIRNSHLTSVAPTGTISLSADNITSGIEPVFNLAYDRKIRKANGVEIEAVTDYGYRVFGVKGKTTDECSVDDHLNVLLVASKYVDSAVSKTCNVPAGTSWESFKDVYKRAYEGGAKGCSTFSKDGKRGGILTDTPKEEPVTSCSIDKKSGRMECS